MANNNGNIPAAKQHDKIKIKIDDGRSSKKKTIK
jgi:hypothetical protein